MDKYFEALEKAKQGIDLSRSFINQDQTAGDALFLDELEKGRKAQLGEIRTWGGKKYQKTAAGWKSVKTGGSSTSKQKEQGGENKLKTDAWNQNISVDQLPEKYKGFTKKALENLKESNFTISDMKLSAYVSSSQEATDDDTEIVIDGKLGENKFSVTMQEDGSGEVSFKGGSSEFNDVDQIVDVIEDLR